MNKQIKAYMLPTEDKSHLIKFQGKLTYGTNSIWKDDRVGYFTQHLYITSDEEIKEGDWMYDIDGDIGIALGKNKTEWEGNRKIIASSDDNISRTGDDGIVDIVLGLELPNVSQTFLKLFVESGGKEDGWRVKYKDWCDYDDDDPTGLDRPDWRLKLDSDNCVTITPVEEKMYSRDEVVKLLNDLNETLNIDSDRTLEDWIKENL